MGLYDVPANVDFILNVTSYSQLIYIGHSMGAAMFYIAAAKRPELNQKIKVMISLGPAASMAYLNSPVKTLAPHVNSIQVNIDKHRIKALS